MHGMIMMHAWHGHACMVMHALHGQDKNINVFFFRFCTGNGLRNNLNLTTRNSMNE